MKPLFIAIILLQQLLSIAYIADGSRCMCSSNDLEGENYFKPGEIVPLEETCFRDMNEELMEVHNAAEKGSSFSTYRLRAYGGCNTGEIYCEHTGAIEPGQETLDEKTQFYQFYNIERPEKSCYGPQSYHYYKVRCPSGYWSVTVCIRNFMDVPTLIGPEEAGPNAGKCLDEIRINDILMGEFNVLCGSNENDDDRCLISRDNGATFKQLNTSFTFVGFGDFEMRFATSQCCGGCGYRVPVNCMPDDVFHRRRKRQAPLTDKEIEQKMRTHFPPIARSVRFGTKNLVIPNGVFISYVDSTIKVFKGEKTRNIFPGIQQFDVHHIFTGFSRYDETANVTYTGYGILMIGHGSAQYMYERIPPEVRLSDQDRQDINDFAQLVNAGLIGRTNQTRVGMGPPGEPPGDDPVCDPECENQDDPSLTGVCVEPEYSPEELLMTLQRAREVVEDSTTHPTTDYYARAFITFYEEL